MLCMFLKIEPRWLNYLLYKLKSSEKYDTFKIKKKSGGERIIDAPIKPLKDIQKSLANVLLNIYKPKICVYSYVKSKGIKNNALIHEGQKWICRIDVKDFFSSIHIGRVIGLFQSSPFGFSRDNAILLAQICCKDDKLPQGAPTSPIISNFICWSLDSQLMNLSKKYRCKYSRYADDIFFSTNTRSFPSAVCKLEYYNSTTTCVLGEELNEIFRENNFIINESKVILVGKSQRQSVTGIIINKKINVPREYVRNIRAMLHSLENDGREIAERKFHEQYDNKNRPGEAYPRFLRVLRGRLEYLGFIRGYDDDIYIKYARKLAKLDERFIFNKRKLEIKCEHQIKLFTEGPTDYLHLKAALEFFQNRGEFTDIKFEFGDNVAIDGGGDLLKFCKQICKSWQNSPHICLFDQDDKDIIGKLKIDPGGKYKSFENNVFAVITPKPDHRKDEELFCIEMYYKDEDLTTIKDREGRRLYLKAEFDKKNGFHKFEDVVYSHILKKNLVAEEVYDKNTKKKTSLSKMAFAQNIFKKKGGFAYVDLEVFRPLFDVITNLLKDL